MILSKFHSLDLEKSSVSWVANPKNNLSCVTQIVLGLQNNLQRAVNRQPWLPRGWHVETRKRDIPDSIGVVMWHTLSGKICMCYVDTCSERA